MTIIVLLHVSSQHLACNISPGYVKLFPWVCLSVLILSISDCTNQNKIWIKQLKFRKKFSQTVDTFFCLCTMKLSACMWTVWDLLNAEETPLIFSFLSLFRMIFFFRVCWLLLFSSSHSLIMTVLPLWYYPSEARSLLICFFFLSCSFFFFINISSVITAVQYRHRSPVTRHKLMFPTMQPFAEA